MKIAFLTFSLKGGGAERMVSRLANAFVARGEQVDIVLFDIADPSYTVDGSIHIFDIGSQAKTKIGRAVQHIALMRKYLKTEKPDVVFCFIFTMIPFAVFGRIGTKIPCKIIGAERANPRTSKKLQRFAVKFFLRSCDGFVFQTDGARLCYPRYSQKHSVVIGNIAPKIDIQRDSKSIRQKSVCSVGRLHPSKDFITLLHAFKIVVATESDATLHIYGQGETKASLVALAKKLQIENNIIFEGFSKSIDAELMKYEIFAFSSKAEGMPNALIEAMACGCACISTDCDFGPRELIKDGENGFLVPVGNVQAMAEKILLLIQNEQLRKQMGQNASSVQEAYSEEKITSAYLNYAKSLVGVL